MKERAKKNFNSRWLIESPTRTINDDRSRRTKRGIAKEEKKNAFESMRLKWNRKMKKKKAEETNSVNRIYFGYKDKWNV